MSHLRTFLVILGFLSLFVPASSAASSSIREKKLSFPPSIQWKTVDAEISLIALAWGPANSPEMISKGRQSVGMEKPELLSDRPYALALRFQAKAPGRASLKMSTCSGLIRIKNVDGDRENPWLLTQSGFLLLPTVGCGAFDVDFKENNPTEYWDFFPVPPSQKEFLFEVFPPTGRGPTSNPVVSFRVMIKANDFVILNASPPMESECPDLTRNFAGTVGPNSRVNLQLTRKGTNLSGTHQYAKIGETLWLKGQVDSLGNFVLEEQSPQNHVTGFFKGKFSSDFRTMTGYFSKPDGSRLQPFEFHEVEKGR